jgi:OCT family organic cation transporter-like MFS transporter 4/5
MCEEGGKKKRKDETEDVVSLCIGEYGRWQLLVTFLLSLVNIPCTFHIFAPTFEAAHNPFWCARPPHFSHLPRQLWINLTSPSITSQVSPQE